MVKAFFAFPYAFRIDYRIAMKRVCSDSGVEAVYGDETRTGDALLDKLRDLIQGCEIGFYDITGLNPNVLVELGIGYCVCPKRTFFMYDQDRHRKTPSAKMGKLIVPSDILGRAHFEYRGEDDLAAQVRKHLRESLGLSGNKHLELKTKALRFLRGRDGARIGEIAAGIGAAESLRHEGAVELRGVGGGAKYYAN
jgi:hypothetical protein